MTLIDANVLTDDAESAAWSIVDQRCGHAEISVGFRSPSKLEAFVGETGLRLAPTPHDALFPAGKAFARYRRTGGTRAGVLPDFFIGAHAQARGLPLLTRDARR